MVANDDCVERYLGRLRSERGCSERTIASYRLDLRELARLAGADAASIPAAGSGSGSGSGSGGGTGTAAQAMAEPDWARVTEHEVRRWVAAGARAGLSARSLARRLSAWRGFFDWLAEARRVSINPARAVRAPRAPRRLPKALAPDVAVRFAEGPAGEDFEALRDQAMLELLYSSGLRLSELTSLDMRHFDAPAPASTGWIDLAEAQLTVRGKGGRTRTVPIGRAALAALQRWLAARAAWSVVHPGADERALFLSGQGRRRASRTVQVRLKRLAIARGVPVDVHPHVLRLSFASHLLQSSGDLRAVQELLGHASIATTQVYTALDFQRLAAVYDAAHPRARRRATGG